MDGVGLLLDQTVDSILLLLVDPVAMGSDSALGGLGCHLAILETLLDAVLVIHGKGGLNLIHNSLVFSHYFKSLLNIAFELSLLVKWEVGHVTFLLISSSFSGVVI